MAESVKSFSLPFFCQPFFRGHQEVPSSKIGDLVHLDIFKRLAPLSTSAPDFNKAYYCKLINYSIN